MITTLVEASLRNRAVILIAAAVLTVAGLFSMQRLPFDAEPDISPVQVLVTTQAPGLAPVDVERSITAPVELVLQGLPGMYSLRSVSRYGLSVVYVRFNDNTSVYVDRNLVSERLQTVQLPPGTTQPQLGPLSDGLSEIYQFQVRGDGQSLMELRTLLDWEIAPQLRQVPGVVGVNVNGGRLKTYEAQVNDEALVRYGLSVTDVFNAIETNNGTAGGATIDHNGGSAIIRGEGLLRGTHDIGNIVLRTMPGGVPVYVRNVARVTEAPMPLHGAVTRDGKGEAVVGVVLMGLGQNTRVVAQRVQTAIQAINRTLPPGVQIVPYYNRANLINRVLDTVAHNMVEGAVLVITVLFLLLGNARAGLIVALAIPLSMLAAVIAMDAAGMSGNLMSLGALDFGLLVDGAVVVVENVMRRRAREPGQPILTVVRDATKEVARPVTFAVLIITAVYLPILSLQGVEGKMFRPMAMTVIFALIASLILALTLMPVLASYLLRGKVAEHESRIVQAVRRRYEPVLARTARAPALTIGLAVALLALAGLAATRLGAQFLPRLDEGALTVTTTKVPGISVPTAVQSQTMVEHTLLRFPEVRSAVTLGGSSEIPTDPMGVEQSDTFILLKPRSVWKTASTQDGLVKAYSAALDRGVPGLTMSWAQPIQMRMDDMLAGIQSDVAVVIHGDDLQTLHDVAERIATVISHVPGAADVQAQQTVGQPYLRVIVNRDAVARYGLNARQVLDLVQSLGGQTVGTLVDGDGRFDIRVRMRAYDRSTVARIAALRVSDGAGHAVPLSEVADVRMQPGPASIERREGQRVILVQANVRGGNVAGFVRAAQDAVNAQVRLPPGYTLSWAGSFKNLQEAMARLSIVVPISLAVIFVLLYLIFESASLAALIFFNVPFAAIGGVFALWLRGLPFSISAAVGFIAVFGIGVLNGVVLVSYIVERRKDGLAATEAARQAASSRLRPVLMTAMVASLGFLPMAFSTNSGAEVQRPLATVVLGGLITATLLTLLVLPAVYPWFDRRKAGLRESTIRNAEVREGSAISWQS